MVMFVFILHWIPYLAFWSAKAEQTAEHQNLVTAQP
jgi:hypothetical protein